MASPVPILVKPYPSLIARELGISRSSVISYIAGDSEIVKESILLPHIKRNDWVGELARDLLEVVRDNRDKAKRPTKKRPIRLDIGDDFARRRSGRGKGKNRVIYVPLKTDEFAVFPSMGEPYIVKKNGTDVFGEHDQWNIFPKDEEWCDRNGVPHKDGRVSGIVMELILDERPRKFQKRRQAR